MVVSSTVKPLGITTSPPIPTLCPSGISLVGSNLKSIFIVFVPYLPAAKSLGSFITVSSSSKSFIYEFGVVAIAILSSEEVRLAIFIAFASDAVATSPSSKLSFESESVAVTMSFSISPSVITSEF